MQWEEVGIEFLALGVGSACSAPEVGDVLAADGGKRNVGGSSTQDGAGSDRDAHDTDDDAGGAQQVALDAIAVASNWLHCQVQGLCREEPLHSSQRV